MNICSSQGILGDRIRDVKVKIVSVDKEHFLRREFEMLSGLSESKFFVRVLHHELISCEEVTVAASDYSSNVRFNKHIAMVMEKGTLTLDNYLLQNREELTHADRLQIVTSLLNIVKDAHKNNIVLMDIKGTNVMLFISDTGLSIWKGIDLGGSLPVSKPLDNSSFMATVSFMAPELVSSDQRSGLHAKFSMDIWSLGVLIFNVLIGKQNQKFWALWGVDDDEEIIRRITSPDFTQSAIDDHIERNFHGSSNSSQRHFLQRMLQKDHLKRPSIESLMQSALLVGTNSIPVSKIFKSMEDMRRELKVLYERVTEEFSNLRSRFDPFLDADNIGELGHIKQCFESLRDMLEGQAQSAKDCKAAAKNLAGWQAPFATADGTVPPALSNFMNEVTAQLSKLLTEADQRHIDAAEGTKLLKQLSKEVNSVQDQIQKVSDNIDGLHATFNILGAHVRDALSHGKQNSSDVQRLVEKLAVIDENARLAWTAEKVIQGWEALKQQIDIVGQTTKEINERVATNTRLVRILVLNTHNVPTLMVLLPMPKKGFKKFDPRNLFRDRAKLVFICGYTMELVLCGNGPKKDGYTVKDLKKWVKKAIPVLKVGLLLLQIGLMSTGIPIPLLGMAETVLGQSDKLSYLKYAEDLLDSVGVPADSLDESTVENAMESVKSTAQTSLGLAQQVVPVEAVMSTLDSLPLESSTDRITQAIRALEGEDRDNMRSAYEAVGSFLRDEDPLLINIGLVKMISNSGKVAWVKNDPTVVEQFMENDGVFPGKK